MPAPGDKKFGPYEIVASIGKGGMGEVYRAQDTRLSRDVAIKVSNEQFTERFEREARVIASLNHTNICHLYDVGPNYLVMELVEGPTLAERLREGPIPLDEALNIARQIADALEAAHEKGITHRDLKPGNIKIRPDGTVKVLDFGLAKVGGTPTTPGDNSPTMTMDQTEGGVILGTAAYMSPEQAKGKLVDQRGDIYSFGAVLYEMVTGTRLHYGETTTEVLASVMREEPQWDKVPPQLHRLLRRCLEKDLQKRQRHIGDVMALVDDAPAASAPVAQQRAGKRWLWLLVAAAGVLAVVAVLALWAPWSLQTSAQRMQFEIQPSEKMTFVSGGYPMISPNGKWVVIPATGSDGVTRMWLRALDSIEFRPLTGTESGNALPPPVFWSPDSRFIAFASTPGPFAPGQLKKLDIASGAPVVICDVTGAVIGGTWNEDGVIVFAANNSPGLFRVSASGGVATPITVADRSRGEGAHRLPQFLPDGRRFLYQRVSNRPDNFGIYVGSIEAKPEEQNLTQVLSSNRQAIYTASMTGGSGHLLFLRDTTLFAQPFDPANLKLSGEAVPIADQVGSFASATAGLFSVSQTGVLAYRVGAGGDQEQLTWFDDQGKLLGVLGEKRAYSNPALSPDGKSVAVTVFGRDNGNSNIWVVDVSRGSSTKITFNAGRDDFPLWSPDGKTIVFSSNRRGQMDLYLKNADGSGEERLLLNSDQDKRPTSWSRDGRFLLYMSSDPKTVVDLWVLPNPTAGGEPKPIPYLQTEFQEGYGTFSPDGRWIAYRSLESGSPQVYVRPFYPDRISESAAGGRWMISRDGAYNHPPRWRADGKAIMFLTPTLQVMAVNVDAAKSFQFEAPRRLFNMPLLGPMEVTADGKQFLMPLPEGTSAPSPFTVVTNWHAVLQK
jgi:Tol biopolymer transport system component/predicted Ser/Thr protein kinase